jgi:putative hydrolase of the HAD superfamily
MSAGVLFDLDETLLDRSASIIRYFGLLWASFGADEGVPEDSFIDQLIRLDGNGYVDRETFFRNVVERVLPSRSAETIAAHFLDNAWNDPILMPGALTGIETLKSRGLKIGIITNGGSRNQRKKIRNTGLDAVADCIVVSEEVGVKKPDPRIFRSAAERIAINPANSWFVGDHPEFDIIGASRVGFQTVWITRSVPWPDSEVPCYTKMVSCLEEAMETIRGAA